MFSVFASQDSLSIDFPFIRLSFAAHSRRMAHALNNI
jgi:hypothetical protein